MYSNIGLSFCETVPLRALFCLRAASYELCAMMEFTFAWKYRFEAKKKFRIETSEAKQNKTKTILLPNRRTLELLQQKLLFFFVFFTLLCSTKILFVFILGI